MHLDLKGKRVLVTGGAGFIGSHTVDALVDGGAAVTVIDDLSSGSRTNLNPEAVFIEMNMADQALETVVLEAKPDVIYHFAYFVMVAKSVEDPLRDMDVMIGTLRLLKACRSLMVKKFIFASSAFLYGNAISLPVEEAAPVEPISPYVVSKYAIENYLQFFERAHGLPYVSLRYATVYGPRQVKGAMADYIRTLGKGGQSEMWGDGTKTRDYVFVKDVVRANLQALDVPDNHPNPIFNIGTGIETSLNTLYGAIAGMLGVKASPVYHPDRPGELIRYCVDNSKAKAELQWRPQYSLERGLQMTVDYARSCNFCGNIISCRTGRGQPARPVRAGR